VEVQGFGGLILAGRSKELTYTFLREGLEERVYPINEDQSPNHDQPFAHAGDCA
jgi:hypothetical protein